MFERSYSHSAVYIAAGLLTALIDDPDQLERICPRVLRHLPQSSFQAAMDGFDLVVEPVLCARQSQRGRESKTTGMVWSNQRTMAPF